LQSLNHPYEKGTYVLSLSAFPLILAAGSLTRAVTSGAIFRASGIPRCFFPASVKQRAFFVSHYTIGFFRGIFNWLFLIEKCIPVVFSGNLAELVRDHPV